METQIKDRKILKKKKYVKKHVFRTVNEKTRMF